jgi:hypothetical protein
MTMTNEEIKEIVSDAIKEGLTEVLQNKQLFCRYAINPELHDEEHAALRKFIKVMARIEDMKWSVLQKIVIGAVGIAFALMVYGAIAKLTVFGGLGWPGK